MSTLSSSTSNDPSSAALDTPPPSHINGLIVDASDASDELPPPPPDTSTASGSRNPLESPLRTAEGTGTAPSENGVSLGHGTVEEGPTNGSGNASAKERNGKEAPNLAPGAAEPSRSGSATRSRRVLGEWTMSKTLGAGSMGKVKLGVSSITGEKVRVLSLPVFCRRLALEK